MTELEGIAWRALAGRVLEHADGLARSRGGRARWVWSITDLYAALRRRDCRVIGAEIIRERVVLLTWREAEERGEPHPTPTSRRHVDLLRSLEQVTEAWGRWGIAP